MSAETRVPIRPRYGEVDSMGIVYHAHYLVYFDVGRTEYMRARGAAYAELEQAGYRLVVVDAGVRYRKPAFYDETLELVVRLASVGPASVRFEYELLGPSGDQLATGHTRLGCLDRERRPSGLPRQLLEALKPGLAPTRGADPGRKPVQEPSELP
jgi:acyl-CoA thioester hydrolase